MDYKVSKVSHPKYNNQLIPLLVDEHSIPVPSASVWGWDLWLSAPLNTCTAKLNDLAIFYKFIDQVHPSFFEDAAKLKFLTHREINKLCSFLLINFKFPLEDSVSVSPSTFNRRLSSINSFLYFHYTRYIERLSDFEKANEFKKSLFAFDARLKKKAYSNSDIENHTKPTETLTEDEIDVIRLVIRPSTDSFINEVNPYRKGLQVRNACLILLLIELGCRASELVLIRNIDSHLKLTTNATVVIQSIDLNETTHRGRRDGAAHKTSNRELPITSGLCDLLLDYTENYRPKLRGRASKNLTDYLFISEKDGGAFTTSGLRHLISSMFKHVPNLANVLHPHKFRVFKGNKLRAAIDDEYENSNSPMKKDGDMQDTLTMWGGWSTTSSMPKRYTNAHIQRKLNDYLAKKDS
ncbi:site-specific integrase [Pseudoalteromonas sp. SR41-1]|nr:site-specific integrase [Pseudoalteromonas sp. SR41-1]MBB1282468.1 site-specific integrase [Pseudoalteromonas sp. SR41-1]|tara:strand:- start:562 stop:1785 length:1224 start_codon:yes stop_codon:yes gene_type:complete